MTQLPEIQAGVREAGSIPHSLSEKFKVDHSLATDSG